MLQVLSFASTPKTCTYVVIKSYTYFNNVSETSVQHVNQLRKWKELKKISFYRAALTLDLFYYNKRYENFEQASTKPDGFVILRVFVRVVGIECNKILV